MCGIVGIVDKKEFHQIFELMKLISHRGPDDSGVFCEDGVAFGHLRLSIVDLSPLGHQPMISLDGNYIIIYNGEIYNHLELKDDLLEKGYVFNGKSDTETLLNGFVEYGVDVLNKLNGIFAFAIYCKKTNEIVIARDQMGVKPLYYFIDNETFYFSSELKAISNSTNFNKDIDYNSLMDYINYLYSPNETTPFINIKKLNAGHYLKYDLNSHEFKIVKYYEIPFNGIVSDNTLKELTFKLERHLFDAIERQMMSDVPVGFFLSGGLDSSLIATIAQQINPDKPIECFTIDNGEGLITNEGFVNDLYYAKLLAKKKYFNLNIVNSKIDIINEFDKMIWHLDEPQADPAPLNVLNICKIAREKGIKVLLGGTGGDDLFSGYRRHRAINLEQYYSLIPDLIRKAISGLSKKLNTRTPFFRRVRKLFINLGESKIERMSGYFSWIPKETILNLFSNPIKAKIFKHNPNQVLFDLLENIPNEKSDLNKMLYWEMRTFLQNHNLNYVDKMSMALGVESRVPFLDLELVKFSTTLPDKYKMNGAITKYILKKVAEKYLPMEIIYRPKSGFGAPVRKWIIEDLNEMIEDRLSPKNIKLRGIFNSNKVWELINENKKGNIDASYTVWSLLAIESWMIQFVDGKKNLVN